MTDSALVHRALEYRRVRAEIKALEREAKTHNEAVLAELGRRRFTPTETEAWAAALVSKVLDDAVAEQALAKLSEPFVLGERQITPVAPTRVSYDPELLKVLVTRAVHARVTRLVVDPAAMATEIEMGRVKAVDIGPARTVSLSSPHIRVTAPAA
jgi:hypothetical protein